MSTHIDDIKARLDIVEVVGGYVPDLKKSGRTWKARCPFHNERTPSFVVDPERGSWHCFGACATGGDVIEFVRRAEHLEFRQALELLAVRVGVELRPPTPREQAERETHERLLRANEAAAVFFQAQLQGPAGADALRYAVARGLDAETQRTWQLGYAPDEWSALTDHLLARGFTTADLEGAGLSLEGERGHYDRFRNRLIFPIRDPRGRLIGFGARALLPDQEPKYLNTPQTPLFDKSATLYGLDRAAGEARRLDRLIVVEGYMDVIGCHQVGIPNVVASMGTSLTDRQMTLAQRSTANLVLALDADNAGSEATLRGIEVAAGVAEHGAVATVDWRGLVTFQDVLNADIRVAALTDGDDPDSLARRDPDRLRALIESAQPVAEHLFAAVASNLDGRAEGDSPRARSRAVELLAPTVAGVVDPVIRAHYVQRLARIGRVPEQTVLQILDRARQRPAGAVRQAPQPLPSPAEVRQAAKRTATVPGGEAQLLQLLLFRPEARDAGLALDPDVFEDSLHRQLYAAWCDDAELSSHPGMLEIDLAERVMALEAAQPEGMREHLLTGPRVAEAVTDIAARLRLRRRQALLQPAAVAVAADLADVRKGGVAASEASEAPPPDSEALASELIGLTAQQRAIYREHRALAAREPTGALLTAGITTATHEADRPPTPVGNDVWEEEDDGPADL